MALIDDVKIHLRISDTAYNTEITDLINAAKADIALGGVLTTSETDALYKMAICTYCKANFGYDNKDADRLNQAYELQKQKLMLALEHSYYTVTFTASAQCTITFDGHDKETDATSYEAVFYARSGNQYPYSVNGASVLYVDVSGDTEVDLT
jgi:hypothetical protein